MKKILMVAVMAVAGIASAQYLPTEASKIPGAAPGWIGVNAQKETVYISGHQAQIGEAVFVAGSADMSSQPTTSYLTCTVLRFMGVQGGSVVLNLEKSSGVISNLGGSSAKLFNDMKGSEPIAKELAFDASCAARSYAQIGSNYQATVYVPLGKKLSLYVSGASKSALISLPVTDETTVQPTIELK